METCPDNIKPKYFSQKSFWRFKNGSELHLHGVNSKNEEKMRGHRADLAIIDEAAQVERLHYLVHDIVMPQFLTTEGKLLVASTPSPRPGHYFKEMYEKAKRDDCLSEYTVYDNTSLNPKLVRKYCEESGGEDSPTWRREYLAKFESDISRIVIPEWDSSKFVEQYERPKKFELYNQYVGMDLGVADFTAAVFGYYDFENATLVIEEEFTSSGASQTTEYIYDSLSIIENRLQYKNIDIRIADNNNPQLLNDLAIMYDYHMSPVSKNTLISMINKLRTWVNAGRIKILPNCSMTIGSLENAWWDIKGLKDEKYKPQIGKDDTYGHFDHLMALVYLIRNVDEHNNPVPPVYNISDNTHFINHEQIEYEESYGEFSDFHDAIKFRP